MSARPEYAMALATIGILVAIGVPALQRGEAWLGGACVAGAVLVAAWKLVEWLRSRR